MALQRRSFLTMLGAACAAPALPVAAGQSSAAVYSRQAYGMAVFHARTHAHVTATGIARRVKVSPVQAKAMIAEMTSAGLVKPVGIAGGHVRAVSNILKPDAWGLKAGAVRAQTGATRHAYTGTRQPTYTEPDLSRLLAHLRKICVAHGIPLRAGAAV